MVIAFATARPNTMGLKALAAICSRGAEMCRYGAERLRNDAGRRGGNEVSTLTGVPAMCQNLLARPSCRPWSRHRLGQVSWDRVTR